MAVDALGDVSLLWLWEHSQSLCTCPAKGDSLMLHSQTCGMSPIYAELASQWPDTLDPRLWLDMTLISKQHVIRCAICGRKRLGRDMDIIKTSGPAYPEHKRIVKAVCPEHNRRGTIGWRYAGVTD